MLMKVLKIVLVLALVAIALALANMRGRSTTTPTGKPAPAPRAISQLAASPHPVSPQQIVSQKPQLAVAFRLDPDLMRGLYLGDRWVSPPSFSFAQPGKRYVVQAKLQTTDSSGEQIDLSGEWATNNPEMVAITRNDNGEVTIVVRRPGEGNVTVSAGGDSKVLHVHAKQTNDGMEVAITQ
jgi:hypothetical protein